MFIKITIIQVISYPLLCSQTLVMLLVGFIPGMTILQNGIQCANQSLRITELGMLRDSEIQLNAPRELPDNMNLNYDKLSLNRQFDFFMKQKISLFTWLILLDVQETGFRLRFSCYENLYEELAGCLIFSRAAHTGSMFSNIAARIDRGGKRTGTDYKCLKEAGSYKKYDALICLDVIVYIVFRVV